MKNLSIIILGTLAASCIQCDSRNIHTDTVHIPSAVDKMMVTDDLFDNFEFIPLETSEESLFGYIDKIIIHNDKFYILDKTKTRRINVFNSNGKFSHTIGKRGDGPEEYTKIEDFTIDEKNGQVIILSFPSILYRYDLEGNFMERKKISDYLLWHICYDGAEGFLCSTDYQSSESDYLIHHYDKDFTLKDRKIKSTNGIVAMPPLNINPFIKDGDKISYFDFYTSTLHWNILNAEEKQIVFEFGNKKVPFEAYKDPMRFYEKQQDYNFFITAVIDKGLFWSSYSNHGQGANILITDITNGKKILLKDSRFLEILCCHDSYFYQAYSPLTFLEGNFNFSAKVISDYSVEFDSNLMILRFKARRVFN
ncbi:MAG: 6-bladed beta-propeller [Prevotellaceae bacterium]|jgi:hypothetical protein|nr:6-bladed beta-propeller [Prevotellaceae bacterium]